LRTSKYLAAVGSNDLNGFLEVVRMLISSSRPFRRWRVGLGVPLSGHGELTALTKCINRGGIGVYFNNGFLFELDRLQWEDCNPRG